MAEVNVNVRASSLTVISLSLYRTIRNTAKVKQNIKRRIAEVSLIICRGKVNKTRISYRCPQKIQ